MAKNLKFDADDLLGNLQGIPIKPIPSAEKSEEPAKPQEGTVGKPAVSTEQESAVAEEPENTWEKSAVSEPAEGETDIVSSITRELGSTRGRKGEKLPFIHSSCTKENYDYITMESRRRGISRAAFLNIIIKTYKDSPEGRAKIDW